MKIPKAWYGMMEIKKIDRTLRITLAVNSEDRTRLAHVLSERGIKFNFSNADPLLEIMIKRPSQDRINDTINAVLSVIKGD